jgi:regulator of sigma E protease
MEFIAGPLKSVVAVVAVFVVCIVIHEFGHYIAAKRFGVAVPAFAVGFGPKLIRWTRGQTEYSLRLFPIGGLVQLAGEVPQDALFRRGEEVALRFDSEGRICVIGDPSDVPGGHIAVLRDFDLMERLQMTVEMDGHIATYPVVPHAKLMTSARSSIPLVEKHEQVLGRPLWQRAIIILAGPVMNFLLAGVLFSMFYAHNGIPQNTAAVGTVIPGTPAASVGLKEGDQILSVGGKPVSTWVDLVNEIRSDNSQPPKPLHLEIRRDGTIQNIVVTPRLNQGQAQLGIQPTVSHSMVESVSKGFYSVYYGSVNALTLYGQVIAHHQFQFLSGPVGIADVISQKAQSGLWQVVMIAGLLSLNLGLFNLLPIPALDGGRLLFMLVEMVRGKSVDPRKEGLVHFVGFALLMLFAVVITYRDVTRLF